MFLSNGKMLAVMALLTATGAGAGLLTALKAEMPVAQETEERSVRATAEVSSEREGRIALIGTDIKEGAKAPDKDQVEIKTGCLAVSTMMDGKVIHSCWKEGDPLTPDKLSIYKEKRTYRKLHIGDAVKKGQLLVLMDEGPALRDLAVKLAALEVAESNWRLAGTTKDEAIRRAQAIEIIMKRVDISEDEYRAALLNRDRTIEVAKAKAAARKLAVEELRSAVAALKACEIRSSDSGVIKEILKRPGEVVRSSEPIIRLEVESDVRDVRQEPAAVFNVPSQREGVLLVVGTEVKAGAKIPANLLVTVKADGDVKRYRQLRVGDAVQEGDLLAKVDDRLARLDLEVQKSKLVAAKADLRAASQAVNTARQSLIRLQKLVASGAVDAATLEAAKSAQDLAVEAVPAKEAAVREAEAVVKKAEIILGMYEIRSPVRGVVKAILKHRGEAVKSLETVVEIQETRKE